MKKYLIIALALVTLGLILITTSVTSAQGTNEFVVPLSDPAKRGHLKAHLNYGSITIKGTARKDVLVKYSTEDDEDDRRHKKNDTKDGLKRIGGGGLELSASENNNAVKVGSDSWGAK